jgi:succinoglycan biosynthesis transport protein ExoP
MTLVSFIKLLYSKLAYIILIPIVFGLITYVITRNLPEKYTSTATLFTGITSNTGLEMMGTRIDNVQTLNEYNNVLSILKSRSLAEETGLRLLAQHLMQDGPNGLIINQKAFDDLMEDVPADIKRLVIKGDMEKSYHNLKHNVTHDKNGYLYKLLNDDHPHYSVKGISKMQVERIGASDLISISYDSDDPAIAFNTIKFATEIFNNKYIVLKKNQSSNAIAYFQRKLRELAAQLQSAEQKLMEYNIANNIINYEEQTKQITTQQEKIELRMQDVKMEYEGAVALLRKLESEIESRYKVNLQNKLVFDIRKQLVSLNNRIAQIQVYNDGDQPQRLQDLMLERARMERRLQNSVDSIYIIDSKTHGIEFQQMMGEWLTALTNLETNYAFYMSMLERHRNFMSLYKELAPVGATLKRYEREINVIENEYLNVLNNLNVALQKEQNMEMVTDMKMMDEATLPLIPNDSRHPLYIMVASLFSLIFYIAGLLVIEILDMRIKNPSNLNLLSDLEVIGAFCSETENYQPAAEHINKRSSVFIFEKIRKLATSSQTPMTIQILSVWDQAGKVDTANHIAQELKQRGWNVKIFNFAAVTAGEDSKQKEDPNDPYSLTYRYYNSDTYEELFSYLRSTPEVIISILPSVSHGIDNSVIIKTADMSIVVYDGMLTWHEAETLHTNKLKQLIGDNIFAVLTNGKVEYLEDMFGELPKERSFIRKKMKKTLTRFAGRS